MFFLNPEGSYYLREMERRLRHSAGTLARELHRFSQEGLLLVGKETLASKKLLKDLETRFGRTLNATTYAPAEFEAKRQDKSEFLFEVMRGPLIQLKPESSHGPAQAA